MAKSEMLVYDSLMSSNIPVEKKSMIRQWFEGMLGSQYEAPRGIGREHVITAVQAFRQSLESNAVAASLGVMHAEMGLDLGKVPVDLVVGTILTGAAIGFARHEVSADMLNMGTAGQNCFSFRKGYAWAAARKKRNGGVPAGNFAGESTMNGETDMADPDADDPILKVAKGIR